MRRPGWESRRAPCGRRGSHFCDWAPPGMILSIAVTQMGCLLRIIAATAIASCIIFGWRLMPPANGIWYIGRPQWLIAVDHAGLTIGPSGDPLHLGWWPVLFLGLASIAIPVWLVDRVLMKRLAARRAVQAGLCVNCGYDIRANADRCSECGHPIVEKSK